MGRGHGSFEHVHQGPPRLIIPSPNQMFPCKYVSSRRNYTMPVYWQWYNLKSATEHNYILVRAIKISFIINGTVRLQLHLCSVASRWRCFTLLKSLLWRSLGCPHHHNPPYQGARLTGGEWVDGNWRAEELGSAKCRVRCEPVLNTGFLAWPEYCISSGTALNTALVPPSVHWKLQGLENYASCHVMATFMLSTVWGFVGW